MIVAVIGQGYVGLPLSLLLIEKGFQVFGIDTDSLRVSTLLAGKSPVTSVKNASVQLAIDSGRYRVTKSYSDLDNLDYVIITVPTPLSAGLPDLTFVEAAADGISPFISAGSTVILESTTYPGTTLELLLPRLEGLTGLRAGQDFFLGYSPERIDPGNKTWLLTNTPKIVSGINDSSLNKIDNFYKGLGIPTVRVSDTNTAELTKLLENTFRHVNIALVNELSLFSHALGIDLHKAIDAASTKPFGFMPFWPGPGVGGHCLPIDPSYLAWAIKRNVGTDFRFVELANQVNAYMPIFTVDRAEEIVGKLGKALQGSRIVVLGLAYKEDVGDIREAPSIAVCQELKNRGADLFAMDHLVPLEDWPTGVSPHVNGDGVQYDLAILLTNHMNAGFEEALRFSRMVLDTKHALLGPNVFAL